MHTHRIEVFDRTDDYDVVGAVAHHLELEFLPAFDRLLDQYLVTGRRLEPPRDLGLEFGRVAGDGTAGAAERARGADDERQSQPIANRERFLAAVRDRRFRNLKPDPEHRALEEVAVLGLLDRF